MSVRSKKSKTGWRLLVALLALYSGVGAKESAVPADKTYDVVIANGRVMDPESGFDAVRNVGISGGKIRAISTEALKGKQTIDAKGLVVAPGFIDLHEHGQEPRNYQYQARDGVTTSLELEAGTADVDSWYAAREGKSLINFGVSIGHIPVRTKSSHEDKFGWRAGGKVSAAEWLPKMPRRIARRRRKKSINESEMEQGFQSGALAEGMGINYTPGASHSEIVEVFRVAAKYGAPVHVHLRYAGGKEPKTGLSALEEVIAAAASTGAPLHVVHITSMGLRYTPELIAVIEGAKNAASM